jgi:hypothetical protein
LARQEGEQPQLVVEVDHALEVQRVVDGRAGRVQAHEAVQRGNGLGFLPVLRTANRPFHLRLLRQRRAGGAAFQRLEQRHRLVVAPEFCSSLASA